MRPWSTLLAVAAVAVLAPGPAHASDRFLKSRLDRLVQVGIPGAQVDDDGRTAASGVANVVTGRPMRPGLGFRVGSVTKSFTATVVLQLVAEHRLRLDDTVARWLPGMLAYGDAVTVHDLLQHTSGVPDYWEAGPDPLNVSFINDPAVRSRAYAPEELVERVAGEPPDFPAGTRVEYSDTNYVLAGMIVEAATGKSLGWQVEHRVIRPLRLRHTAFAVAPRTLPRPFTRGYSVLFGADGLPADGPLIDVTEYDPSALWGMGNIVSTPADLRTFYRALLGGRLLPAGLTARMKRTRPNQTADWPDGVGMGLGIWSWDLPCGVRIYGHEGEVPGSNTWAFGTADGRHMVVMQHNLLYLNWDRWYDTVLPTYFSLWCHRGSVAKIRHSRSTSRPTER
jgi:D-alanyl-D-alanine carboxypeptidase